MKLGLNETLKVSAIVAPVLALTACSSEQDKTSEQIYNCIGTHEDQCVEIKPFLKKLRYYTKDQLPSDLHEHVRGLIQAGRIKAQLAGLNISNIDLSQLDLSNLDFSYTTAVNANFSGSTMKNTNFSGATLTGSNFSQSNTSFSNFSYTQATRVNFSQSSLFANDFTFANLKNSNFYKSKIRTHKLKGTNMRNSNFCDTDARMSTSYKLFRENIPKFYGSIRSTETDLHRLRDSFKAQIRISQVCENYFLQL